MNKISTVIGLVCGMCLSIFVISCVTTNKESSAEKEPVQAQEKPAEKPKTTVDKEEFTKSGFVERLSETLKKGTVADALKLYDTVPAQFADDFDLLFLKASLLVSAGKFDDAKTICTSLHERDPENTDVLELSAVIAKAQGNTAERNTQISALLAKDPNNASANIALAEDAMMQRSYKKAKNLYVKALTNDPSNEQALLGYGQVCYFTEDDDIAESTFNKLIAQNPENDQAFYYLGKLQAAQNKYKVAADNVAKAIELDATNYDYYLEYGMDLRYMGKFDDAAIAWTKAIALEPDYFLGYVYRAGLYDEQNLFDKALSDYRMVVQLNPEYYFAYESIGVLALHDKNWKEARAAFMKCREKNKENISYPLMITYCYYMEGDKVNAKKFSDTVLRVMDKTTVEYTMLRAFHDETDKLPLEQRIAATDNSNRRGKMYFYLGLLYDMFGGSELAKKYYAQVINMNSPMFFEYRLAEWNTEKVPDGNE